VFRATLVVAPLCAVVVGVCSSIDRRRREDTSGPCSRRDGRAASPALIEKVRSAVTDANGPYRVEDLRPGTYAVTFKLAGFNACSAGIELTARLRPRSTPN
jgi:hypothetical protein